MHLQLAKAFRTIEAHHPKAMGSQIAASMLTVPLEVTGQGLTYEAGSQPSAAPGHLS